MAAASSGTTPMDTANVAPPFDTPHFASTDGAAPLDMEIRRNTKKWGISVCASYNKDGL